MSTSTRILGIGRLTVSAHGACLTMTVARTAAYDRAAKPACTDRDRASWSEVYDVANVAAREHGCCDIMTADGILVRQVEVQS